MGEKWSKKYKLVVTKYHRDVKYRIGNIINSIVRCTMTGEYLKYQGDHFVKCKIV